MVKDDRGRGVLVGFKLETDRSILFEKVAKSFAENGCDFVVANTLSEIRKRVFLFGSDNTRVPLAEIESPDETSDYLEQKIAEALINRLDKELKEEEVKAEEVKEELKEEAVKQEVRDEVKQEVKEEEGDSKEEVKEEEHVKEEFKH